MPIPSGNEAFDLRWMMLAGEDGPQVRRMAQDGTVQGLLLGTDDGDEFWSAGGSSWPPSAPTATGRS